MCFSCEKLLSTVINISNKPIVYCGMYLHIFRTQLLAFLRILTIVFIHPNRLIDWTQQFTNPTFWYGWSGSEQLDCLCPLLPTYHTHSTSYAPCAYVHAPAREDYAADCGDTQFEFPMANILAYP